MANSRMWSRNIARKSIQKIDFFFKVFYFSNYLG